MTTVESNLREAIRICDEIIARNENHNAARRVRDALRQRIELTTNGGKQS